MEVPEAVRADLGGDEVVAAVDLGGDDGLFVAPDRTLVYRSEGLLSDESVETYPHDAERVAVSESRRKATITLDYGLDGERSLTVSRKVIDDVLHPLLAGILSAADVVDAGETVERTFRFSELTLVITSARVVKHIGPAVWDEEYEAFHYDDVTDLTFEEGGVATSVVLALGDRQERFKAPKEDARAVREALIDAVTSYHEVPDLATLRERRGSPAEPDDDAEENVDFSGGLDPLSAQPAEVQQSADDTPTSEFGQADPQGMAETDGTSDSAPMTANSADMGEQPQTDDSPAEQDDEITGTTSRDELEGAGFEPAAPADDIAAELAELRTIVERQEEQLERQADLIDQLIEELRRIR